MRVDVQARRTGEHYMVECSECGPVGVVVALEAVENIKEHLRWHGVQHISEGAPE